MSFEKTPKALIMMLLSAVLVIAVMQVASAQTTLYDNFNGRAQLDPDKWKGFNFEWVGGSTLELRREVTGGQLAFSQRVYGDTTTDEGEFFAQNGLTAPIQPTALSLEGRFLEFEMNDCPVAGSPYPNTFVLLRISNPLFNDGTADVYAWLDVSHYVGYDEANYLAVTAILFHAGNTLGVLDLGPVRVGQRFTLWMEWLPDNDEVRFRKDNDPVGSISYTLSDALPPEDILNIVTETAAANCTVERAFAGMEVYLDNVYINP